MRLATSQDEQITVCAGPTADVGEDPDNVAATFAQLREMMAADYGSGPQGTIYVHFADPLHWEFPPAQMGWLPSPSDKRGQNSNAHRQSGRVVKNHWGIYMRADGDSFDRAEWCWAMAEYFGTRDVPNWFRHSSARVSGLLDWLPSLDESTTESEDVAAAKLVAEARAFLNSEEQTVRLEVVHAAAREKYGKDLFRKFWQIVHGRPPEQAGPIDKIAVMAYLSQAADGEDVTPLYRRWKGFATEGPVDPLTIGELKELPGTSESQ